MLGSVVGLTRLVKPESITKVLKTKVPKDLLEMNQKALGIGLRLAESFY
jgi:2-oxoglutarate ferredoxin oxidoreductase subunit gamma